MYYRLLHNLLNSLADFTSKNHNSGLLLSALKSKLDFNARIWA